MRIGPLAVGLFCLVASIPSALALGSFDLEEPQLAFPKGFPESARVSILAALRRPDCRFVGGSFINSFTNLKYEGETRALNFFLDGLVQRPGVVLSLRFHTQRETDDCDWFVTHLAGKPREFAVHVNLKSPRIKMDELVIPESKGPPLPGTER